MKMKIQRNYDVTVCPYDSDEEDCFSYKLEIRNITDRFVAMHIIDSGLYDTYSSISLGHQTHHRNNHVNAAETADQQTLQYQSAPILDAGEKTDIPLTQIAAQR